jgi:hypothetical protein
LTIWLVGTTLTATTCLFLSAFAEARGLWTLH